MQRENDISVKSTSGKQPQSSIADTNDDGIRYVTVKISPPLGQEGKFKYKVWLKCYSHKERSAALNLDEFRKLKKHAFNFELENAIGGKPCTGIHCPFAIADKKAHKCPTKLYDVFVVANGFEVFFFKKEFLIL